MADPPSDVGGVNAADSWRSEPATVLPVIVGALGVVAGVADCAAEPAPAPTALTARTLTAYVVPLTSPETAMGLVSDGAVVHPPATVSWYWYEVIVDPPVAPGVNASDTELSPGTTDVTTGAAGRAGVVTLDDGDAVPAPVAFTARIATEYVVPFARPVMVNGLDDEPLDTHEPPLSWY